VIAPDSNKVVNTSKVIQKNKGHAVYANTTRKETTVGPEVELFYNYPEEGNISGGWD
jgi:hypothetical protein